MSKEVYCLYPGSAEPVPLRGLYLRRPVLADANPSRPVVYANFLSSLDGRIALFDKEVHQYVLPSALKCDEDFQLFLELYAQADCIVTHGGYMRSLAEGRLGNVLQLPREKSAEYLHEWRKERGMNANPDVVILSGSLQFPWHESLDRSDQKVYIGTGGHAQQKYKDYWKNQGHPIHQFGSGLHADASELMNFLEKQGYRSIYLVAGPDLLHNLIVNGDVDRFYLTMSQQFLGGENIKTLLSGSVLGDHGQLELQYLYMDPNGSNGVGQLYSEYKFKNS